MREVPPLPVALLGEEALPPLGFSRTGNNYYDVSDAQLDAAIRGFTATGDEYNVNGIRLVGCPSKERRQHEGFIAHRGWFRAPPSLAVCALRLRHAKPDEEVTGAGTVRPAGAAPLSAGVNHDPIPHPSRGAAPAFIINTPDVSADTGERIVKAVRRGKR